VLPIPGDEGIKPGWPPLVPQEQLGLLNEGIHNHVGKVETKKDLSTAIVTIGDKRYKDQNIDWWAKMPSCTSQMKYNAEGLSSAWCCSDETLWYLSSTCLLTNGFNFPSKSYVSHTYSWIGSFHSQQVWASRKSVTWSN
jgi:hypothetical protein